MGEIVEFKNLENEFDTIIEMSVIRMFTVINFEFVTKTYSDFCKKSQQESEKNLLEYLREYDGKRLKELYCKLFSNINIYSIFEVSPLNKIDSTTLKDNYFYPTFKINHNKIGFKKIDLYVTRSFKENAIKGFKNRTGSLNPNYQEHNINYFTKYLWHTFTHNFLQEINENNFKEFKGEAREDSDFLADSIATYMLLISYGLPMVYCNHHLIQNKDDENDKMIIKRYMIFILQNNRCNHIFINREDKRENPNNDINFRFKRNLLNKLTGYILAEGFTLEEVKVFLREDHSIILRINGKYLYTNFKPNLDTKKNIIPDREPNKNLFNEIINFVTSKLTNEFALIKSSEKMDDFKGKKQIEIGNIIEKTIGNKRIWDSMLNQKNYITNSDKYYKVNPSLT